MQAAYLDSGVTESVQIRRAEALSQGHGALDWREGEAGGAAHAVDGGPADALRHERSPRVAPVGRATSFERYQPSLLVVSSPGLIFSEMPLLRTASRRGVASMAIDPSWDNFTNKLLPVRRVTRLVVWNELMKQQAIELHGYEPDEIRIAGTPQWDRYFREGVTIGRDAFFRRIGADPSRKLVTVTTTPRELYPHHDHVLRVLARRSRIGRWPIPRRCWCACIRATISSTTANSRARRTSSSRSRSGRPCAPATAWPWTSPPTASSISPTRCATATWS